MYRLTRLLAGAILVFVLVSGLAAQAQDVNTMGLSDADYAVLQTALEQTGAASSFRIAVESAFGITGAFSGAVGSQSLAAAGDGAVIPGDTPSLQVTVTGTTTGINNFPGSFSRDLVVVDGTLYTRLNGASEGVWESSPASDLFGNLNDALLLVMDSAAIETTELNAITGFLQGFAEIDLTPFTQITRLPDEIVEGSTLIPFTATIDVDQVIKDPVFAPTLATVLADQFSSPDIPPAQLNAAGVLIGTAFEGSLLTVKLSVGSDNLVKQVSANLLLALDATTVTGEANAGQATVTFRLDVGLSNFNETVTILPPEAGAQPVVQPSQPTPLPVSAGETIVANSPVTVELDSSTVALVYNASGPQTIMVSARSLDGNVDTILDVLSADGVILERNDDANNPPEGFSDRDSIIEGLGLSAAGAYTIQVSSFSGVERGTIEIALTVMPSGFVASTGAKVLLLSEPLLIQLMGNGPVDLVYTIDAPATISVYARSLAANSLDTTLEVLDAVGNSLEFNDDLATGVRDAGIENLLLPAAGSYTIRVGTFDPTEAGGVQVELLEGSVVREPTPEVDDTVLLDTTADLDGRSPSIFTFTGTAGDTVTVSAQAIEPPAPDMDLSLIIYGPDGDEVASDDDSGASAGLGETDPLAEFTLSDDGEYRVEVRSYFIVSGQIVVRVEKTD
ncbi:MAG: PPC domain-containing protein [Anaerolineae bacterium]|nr:PPC domain-containing protein [Anaerolineae bacterium]